MVFRCFSAGSGAVVCASLRTHHQQSSPMRFYSDLSLAFFFSALCWSVPAHAFDVSTQQVVISGYATSMVTSAPFDHKLIAAAHDDAAAFVASDGLLRGAQLESALDYLHRTQPKLHVSDLELAQAILVQ